MEAEPTPVCSRCKGSGTVPTCCAECDGPHICTKCGGSGRQQRAVTISEDRAGA